jgi:hypothetical protein
MAEILTESFCERCGTRYTFEAAIPKKRRIGKLKVLSKGLRNYVLSEDASLDEALAEARSEEERELSGGQLDAFHQTFQFCMSCRQYTCANCWNDAEGRCLSCAPLSLVGGQLRSPLDDLLAGGGMSPFTSTAPAETEPGAAATGNGHAALDEPAPPELVGSAWPTIDLFRTPDASPDGPAVSPSGAEPSLAASAFEAPPVPETVATSQEPAVEDPGVDAAPTSDFWARPFTGFAPLPQPGNGHDPSAASAPAPVDEPALEPAAEQPAEALTDADLAAPEMPAEAALAAPLPAPLDPDADARAAELAERTTRLLGRFRVQPRSAASGLHSQPLDAGPAPAIPPAPAPSTTQPTTPATTPAVAPVSQPGPAAPTQPAWMSARPPEPAPVAEPEPVVAVEPEPVVAAEPEPEPVDGAAIAAMPAEPEAPGGPEAAAEPEPPADVDRPQLRPAAIDRIEMPAWPTPVRPPLSDSAPIPAPISVAPPARAPTPPAVPVAPQWPAPLRPDLDMSSTPFWASDAGRADLAADVWTASAREVTGAPGLPASQAGVQSCVSCGLSLSANARFCRRCGSRQG